MTCISPLPGLHHEQDLMFSTKKASLRSVLILRRKACELACSCMNIFRCFGPLRTQAEKNAPCGLGYMSESTDVTNSLMQKISDLRRTYFLPQQFGRHTLNPKPSTQSSNSGIRPSSPAPCSRAPWAAGGRG